MVLNHYLLRALIKFVNPTVNIILKKAGAVPILGKDVGSSFEWLYLRKVGPMSLDLNFKNSTVQKASIN